MTLNDGTLTCKKEAYLIERLRNPGLSIRKLSALVGVSVSTAERYEQDPAIRDAIAREFSEAKEMLRRTRLKATEELAKLLDSRKDGIKLQAIKLILEGISEADDASAPTEEADTPKDNTEWMQIIKQARGLATEEAAN